MIDCGQFKALPRPQRVQLAEIVVRVAEYQESVQEGMGIPDAKKRVADLVRDFGVKFVEGKEDDNDLACSVALFLFLYSCYNCYTTGVRLLGLGHRDLPQKDTRCFSPLRFFDILIFELVVWREVVVYGNLSRVD